MLRALFSTFGVETINIKALYIKKYFSLLILLTVCILMISCSGKKGKETTMKGPPPNMSQKVEGFVVRATSINDNLELPGSLLANEATEIHPEISGRLTYLNIAEGKNVGRGTLLAKIYDGDLVAQLNKLNVQLKQAKQTLVRYEELLKIDGVSRQEFDLRTLDISNIQADIAIVRSNILRTQIKAPFSGSLGLKNVSPGAYVTPATVITTLRQNSDLKIDFSIPEAYTDKLKIGSLVNFTIDGVDKTYTARITASEMGISLENRSLLVRATVIKPDNSLLPGGFVKVKTNFEPDNNALMIPSQAILPQARGKQVVVYRNGVAFFEDIKTGLRDSAMVQVTNGLKVGDTIITSGLMSLRPQAKIELSGLDKP